MRTKLNSINFSKVNLFLQNKCVPTSFYSLILIGKLIPVKADTFDRQIISAI